MNQCFDIDGQTCSPCQAVCLSKMSQHTAVFICHLRYLRLGLAVIWACNICLYTGQNTMHSYHSSKVQIGHCLLRTNYGVGAQFRSSECFGKHNSLNATMRGVVLPCQPHLAQESGSNIQRLQSRCFQCKLINLDLACHAKIHRSIKKSEMHSWQFWSRVVDAAQRHMTFTEWEQSAHDLPVNKNLMLHNNHVEPSLVNCCSNILRLRNTISSHIDIWGISRKINTIPSVCIYTCGRSGTVYWVKALLED